MIYQNFTLSFYSVLRQDMNTLKLVVNDEKTINLESDTVINLDSGSVSLPHNCNLMHMAILLNQPQIVDYLLTLNYTFID